MLKIFLICAPLAGAIASPFTVKEEGGQPPQSQEDPRASQRRPRRQTLLQLKEVRKKQATATYLAACLKISPPLYLYKPLHRKGTYPYKALARWIKEKKHVLYEKNFLRDPLRVFCGAGMDLLENALPEGVDYKYSVIDLYYRLGDTLASLIKEISAAADSEVIKIIDKKFLERAICCSRAQFLEKIVHAQSQAKALFSLEEKKFMKELLSRLPQEESTEFRGRMINYFTYMNQEIISIMQDKAESFFDFFNILSNDEKQEAIRTQKIPEIMANQFWFLFEGRPLPFLEEEPSFRNPPPIVPLLLNFKASFSNLFPRKGGQSRMREIVKECLPSLHKAFYYYLRSKRDRDSVYALTWRGGEILKELEEKIEFIYGMYFLPEDLPALQALKKDLYQSFQASFCVLFQEERLLKKMSMKDHRIYFYKRAGEVLGLEE